MGGDRLQAVGRRIIARKVGRYEESSLWTPSLRMREFESKRKDGIKYWPSEVILYEIVSVGPHIRHPEIRPGTIIATSWVHGVKFKWQDEEYIVLDEEEIYGIDQEGTHEP